MEFAKRVKGQRYDKSLLPMFLSQQSPTTAKCFDSDKEYPIELLGEFQGYDGFGVPCMFMSVAVTTPTHIVPAYRKAEDDSYCIVQNYGRKAVRVSPNVVRR